MSVWVCPGCGATLRREEHAGKSYDDPRKLCGAGGLKKEDAVIETSGGPTDDNETRGPVVRLRQLVANSRCFPPSFKYRETS